MGIPITVKWSLSWNRSLCWWSSAVILMFCWWHFVIFSRWVYTSCVLTGLVSWLVLCKKIVVNCYGKGEYVFDNDWNFWQWYTQMGTWLFWSTVTGWTMLSGWQSLIQPICENLIKITTFQWTFLKSWLLTFTLWRMTRTCLFSQETHYINRWLCARLW